MKKNHIKIYKFFSSEKNIFNGNILTKFEKIIE